MLLDEIFVVAVGFVMRRTIFSARYVKYDFLDCLPMPPNENDPETSVGCIWLMPSNIPGRRGGNLDLGRM
jgi:hypothetical protein